jgi:hypothetical protein
MKRTAMGVLMLVLLLVAAGLLASSVSAGASVLALLDDASDGVVNGKYSAAAVRAALAVVRGDPAYMQYSDIEGVLVDYLAAITPAPRPSPTPRRTPTPTSTPAKAMPSQKATPNHNGTSADDEKQGGSKGTESEATPGSSAAPATIRPLPGVTGWEQAKTRLAAVPWFFAVGAAALIGGVVLARRRRSG